MAAVRIRQQLACVLYERQNKDEVGEGWSGVARGAGERRERLRQRGRSHRHPSTDIPSVISSSWRSTRTPQTHRSTWRFCSRWLACRRPQSVETPDHTKHLPWSTHRHQSTAFKHPSHTQPPHLADRAGQPPESLTEALRRRKILLRADGKAKAPRDAIKGTSKDMRATTHTKKAKRQTVVQVATPNRTPRWKAT